MLLLAKSNLVDVFVTTLRNRNTVSAAFRQALEMVTTLLLANVLASMPVNRLKVHTPLGVK